MDNLGGVSFIRKGSMKPVFNPIADSIALMSQWNDINLKMRWLRRTENVLVDKLSRWVDLDDWGISDELFALLQDKFGACDINRSASDRNNKLARFIRCFACPNAEAINVLTQDWLGTLLVCPPPLSLVVHCLEHLQSCKVCTSW